MSELRAYTSTTKRRQACDWCHQVKQECSKEEPCARCKKNNVPCTYVRPQKPMGRPRTRTDGNVKNSKNILQSTKVTYSNQGCSNCKKLKRKCDEIWPTCGHCARNNMSCSGSITRVSKPAKKFCNVGSEEIASRSKRQKSRTNSTTTKPDSELDSFMKLDYPNYNDIKGPYDTGAPTNINSNVSVGSPGSVSGVGVGMGFGVGMGVGSFQFGSNDLGSSVNDLTPLLSSASKFNYRERLFLNSLIGNSPSQDIGLNYEGTTPKNDTPNNSTRVNLTTSPSQSVVSDASSEFMGDARYEVEKARIISLCDFAGLGKRQHDLLCYFVKDVSPLLFVDKTATHFLQTVVPLCLQDNRIQYPVLAMAAAHRAKCGSGNIDQVRDAFFYRARAQGVFAGINTDYFTSDNVLWGLLLTAILEILEGTSLYWDVALEKLAKIVNGRGGIEFVSESSPLAAQLFCYLDLISSLSTCSSPHIESKEKMNTVSSQDGSPYENVFQEPEASPRTFKVDYDQKYVTRLLNSKFGFKFGIAGEIFSIIGNISTLASLRNTRLLSKTHEQEFNTLSNMIEMRLQQWSPPLDTIASMYSFDESVTSGRLQISSYTLALQWAAFLRLNQVRFGYNRKDSRVQAGLRIILQSISVIDKGVELETGLLFPLVMAGSVAYANTDQDYILERLRSIRDRLKFNYIDEFEKLLLQVWTDDEGDSVNWAKIRFYQFPGLVMF
ncbi:hypothetical protein CAAN1_11S03642 [[Candida] anglica]